MIINTQSVPKRINYRPNSAIRKTISSTPNNKLKKDPISFDDLPGSTITKHNKSTVLKIGSSMPKSSLTLKRSNKIIRPPAEIEATPILKAAQQIDEQTISIQWRNIDNVLQYSKQNITRLKEIYMPLRYSKFTETPSKTKEKFHKDTHRSFLEPHTNSIQEEVKEIFNSPDKDKTSFAVQTDNEVVFENKSLLDYISQARKNSPIKIDRSIENALQIKKFQSCEKKKKQKKIFNSCKKIKVEVEDERPLMITSNNSYAPSKILIKIRQKMRDSSMTNPGNMVDLSEKLGNTTCYGIQMKGKKVKSRYGAMFVPQSDYSLTPNHFLNNNFILQ